MCGCVRGVFVGVGVYVYNFDMWLIFTHTPTPSHTHTPQTHPHKNVESHLAFYIPINTVFFSLFITYVFFKQNKTIVIIHVFICIFLILDSTQTTQSGSWMFDSVIQESRIKLPAGIACDGNAGIIVADSDAHTVHVYNEDGVYQRALDVGKGLDKGKTSVPWCVVTIGTTCYLTDGTAYVREFNSSNGAYKMRWLTVAPGQLEGNKKAELNGIGMDRAGNLLVGCTTSPAYISKHRNDGSHIHSFPVSIRPKPVYLAVTPQDTVIISGGWKVTIVNQALGETLHSVQYPGMSFPCGVHCHGNVIYVCDYFNISCLSVSGEYIGCIPPDTSKYVDGGCCCVCVNEEGNKM